MAFDRQAFLEMYLSTNLSGPRVLADELVALHAEIEALKAAMPAPQPDRETGWAVRSASGVYTRVAGFEHCACGDGVIWFPDKGAALVLVDALGYGWPSLLYKDTLEEVAPDA